MKVELLFLYSSAAAASPLTSKAKVAFSAVTRRSRRTGIPIPTTDCPYGGSQAEAAAGSNDLLDIP